MAEHLVSDYLNSPAKRRLDLAIASSVGTLSLAGGVLTALSVMGRDRVAPVFRQDRVGKGRLPISVIKLRTMHQDGQFVRGGERIRQIGLDETPQFINIALGHMSVVGYRPLLAEDVNHAADRLRDHFTPGSPHHPDRWLTLREQCKPGITGPSQTMPLRPDAGSLTHLADVIAEECAYMEQATMAADLHFIRITPQSLQNGHNPTVTRAA